MISETDITAGEAKLRALVEAGDSGVIEDLRSLSESAPYVIRIDWASDPIECERCRMPVVAVAEWAAGEDWRTRPYQRAIWERETVRKHTLRRCEAMQVTRSAIPET